MKRIVRLLIHIILVSLNEEIQEMSNRMSVLHRANESLVEKSNIKDRYIEQLKVEKGELLLQIENLTESYERERKSLQVVVSPKRRSSLSVNAGANPPSMRGSKMSFGNKNLQDLASLKKPSLNGSLNNSITEYKIVNLGGSVEFKDAKQLDLKKRYLDLNDKWKSIIQYLDEVDVYRFSLVSKEYHKLALFAITDYLYEGLEATINSYRNSKKRYESMTFAYPFSLHPTCNSALKILNTPKHLEVFNQSWNYFDNVKLLPIYHLLFQLTMIYDDNFNTFNKKIFIEKFKDYFLEKTLPLGDCVKSLVEKCSFKEENILKLKEIVKHFKVSCIDTIMIGKVCKTTGILSFFVKEALVFCGLDQDGRKNKDAKFEERVELIRENLKYRELKIDLEKKIGKMELLVNRYNK
jgi:hypothetical protein